MALLHIINIAEPRKRRAVSELDSKEQGGLFRRLFHLDQRDNMQGKTALMVPDSVNHVSPEFMQGFIGPSIRNFDTPQEFFEKYNFVARPQMMAQMHEAMHPIFEKAKPALEDLEDIKPAPKPEQALKKSSSMSFRMY